MTTHGSVRAQVSRLLVGFLLLLWTGFVIPRTAEALFYTLSASIDLSTDTGGMATGITGSLDPSATTAGSNICLDGSCSFGTQDVLVFKASIASGSIDELRAGIGLKDIKGMGMFTGSDVDATSGALDAPLGFPPFTVIAAQFDFDGMTAPNPNIDSGEMSNVLFITFDSGTLANNDTAGFMLQGPSVALFAVEGPISQIPEPGSLVLLAGAVALAAAGRRRAGR